MSVASPDTFERAFAALDPTRFEQAFREWVAGVIPALDQEQACPLAVDAGFPEEALGSAMNGGGVHHQCLSVSSKANVAICARL